MANSPFSADDLSLLHKTTGNWGSTELVSPDRDVASPVLRRIVQAGGDAPEVAALTQRYHIDLTAPTDDRPFFFNQLVLTDLASIKGAAEARDGVIRGNLAATKTIGIIVLLSAILVLVTLIIPSLPAIRRAQASLAWLGTAYFALIGLGFMFIEIGIIQRVSLFLGHPVYGLAVGLFSIILSTGIGSLISERLKLDTPQKLAGWAVSLCLFVVLLSFWFPPLVAAFEGQGLVVRVLVALAAIVPSGLLMGFGFPTGMRLVNAIDTQPDTMVLGGQRGVRGASGKRRGWHEYRLFDQHESMDRRRMLSLARAGRPHAGPHLPGLVQAGQSAGTHLLLKSHAARTSGLPSPPQPSWRMRAMMSRSSM